MRTPSNNLVKQVEVSQIPIEFVSSVAVYKVKFHYKMNFEN